jgi:hypothetical protein
MALPNRISLRPDLLWLPLNLALIFQCLSWYNTFFFNFKYPLRCLSVWSRSYRIPPSQHIVLCACSRRHINHFAMFTIRSYFTVFFPKTVEIYTAKQRLYAIKYLHIQPSKDTCNKILFWKAGARNWHNRIKHILLMRTSSHAKGTVVPVLN